MLNNIKADTRGDGAESPEARIYKRAEIQRMGSNTALRQCSWHVSKCMQQAANNCRSE